MPKMPAGRQVRTREVAAEAEIVGFQSPTDEHAALDVRLVGHVAGGNQVVLTQSYSSAGGGLTRQGDKERHQDERLNTHVYSHNVVITQKDFEQGISTGLAFGWS